MTTTDLGRSRAWTRDRLAEENADLRTELAELRTCISGLLALVDAKHRELSEIADDGSARVGADALVEVWQALNEFYPT